MISVVKGGMVRSGIVSTPLYLERGLRSREIGWGGGAWTLHRRGAGYLRRGLHLKWEGGWWVLLSKKSRVSNSLFSNNEKSFIDDYNFLKKLNWLNWSDFWYLQIFHQTALGFSLFLLISVNVYLPCTQLFSA